MGRALRIGLYSPFFGQTIGGGEKYLGVTAEAVRDGFPGHTIDLIGTVRADRELYESMLGLDLTGINLVSTEKAATPIKRWANRTGRLRRLRNLYIARQAASFTKGYDLILTMVYVIPARSVARRTVILCQFPYDLTPVHWGKPWLPHQVNGPSYRAYRWVRSRILGKDIEDTAPVICYSQFVRRHIGVYWNRDATVVNPPIDMPPGEPDWSLKGNRIVSVGRFFVSGHSKRQDIMARAFREMCDAGLTGWELHLAGGVHRQHAPSARWFEQLERDIDGYPIFIHADASYEKVQELYRGGSIYWHASGFEVDPDESPILLEHFGMTTAEAMAHGTVPVAINAGGQPEIIEEGRDGFLWSSLDELKAKTARLIADPGLRREVGEAARASSRRYSRENFKQHMVEEIKPVIDDLLRTRPAGSSE